jgi:hypothetical protein
LNVNMNVNAYGKKGVLFAPALVVGYRWISADLYTVVVYVCARAHLCAA